MTVYAYRLAFNINRNNVASFANILNAVAGQQEYSRVESVTEEYSCETLCDYAAYSVI